MPIIRDSVGSAGPIVRVRVGIGVKYLWQLRMALRPIPQPLMLDALIDTGADVSCLDARHVRALQLSSGAAYKLVNAPGLSGLTFAGLAEVQLHVLHQSGSPADNLRIDDLPVADVSLGTARFDMLIGRDVLALCDLLYEGRAGRFTLTY